MKPAPFFKRLAVIPEDWLAVIVGLTLTLLAWIGVMTKVPWPVFGWWK